VENWWTQTFPEGRKTLTIVDVTGNPVNISYGEKGQGAPLILVHGIGSWSYGWRKAIDPLAEHFRVICFDAKGHGFSDKPSLDRQAGYQISEFLQIVETLGDREPVIVVSQSLGALITLAAIEERPDLFSHSILINVPIFLEALPNWWMPLIARVPIPWIEAIDRSKISQKLANPLQKIVRYVRREVVANPEDITAEDVEAITYPYIQFSGAIAIYVNDLQLALREIEAKIQKRPNLITEIENRLGRIQQPTLILWGDRDRWFSIDRGEKLYQALPNAELKVLNQCGHDAAATAPEQICREVKQFLADSGFNDKV
jgi:pimeloyl-ACP methyl ester carboxylesterase